MTDDVPAGGQQLDDPYPFQSYMGYAVTRWEPDYATVEMDIRDVHGNRHGIPHGGIYCILLDTVSGYCGTFTGEGRPPRKAMTVSLTVNFVARPSGRRLIATGRRVGGGRSLFYTELELRCDEGTLVATGQGVMKLRREGGTESV